MIKLMNSNRHKWIGSALAVLMLLPIVACSDKSHTSTLTNAPSPSTSAAPLANSQPTAQKPASMKLSPTLPPLAEGTIITQKSEGVFYEIFVRSFADSNEDGIGDLQGIIQKLDYLNDGNPQTTNDLGVTGIWMMPIFKSPTYHGYDAIDYYDINPQYGTINDLKELVQEAHKRGIKIILDLAANHTSNMHPWFIASAKDDKSKYHDWYVWAEENGYDPKKQGPFGLPAFYGRDSKHYMGIFWQGMPDLNYDNQEVRDEMVNVGKFWMKIGIDGFRLDAAKHLYENLPEDRGKEEIYAKNVSWWQEFRQGLETINPNPYIVGEIWDTPAVIAPHLNQALDAGFNFELQKQILSISKSEIASPLGSGLNKVYELYYRSSYGQASDATFISNHDMDRAFSQLTEDVNQAKTAASLHLTLPGTPFIYYGDEIGMNGRKPDEYIREPFIWYKGHADGKWQTKWEPSRFNMDNPRSVEEQINDPDSLLSHYRNLIHYRNAEPLLQFGALKDYKLDTRNVQAYLRYTKDAQLLVMINITFQPQTVELTDETFKTIDFSNNQKASLNGKTLTLPPYTTVILKP
jgi:alpha-amylase